MKKFLLYFFGISSVLLFADCVAYYFWKISYAGYYTDVVLFWMWLLSSLLLIIVFWKKGMVKLLLGSILLALVVSILPLMLPFYTIMLSMTSKGLYVDKSLNENYRAQIVGYSVMVTPWLEIIEKKGLFERKTMQCMEWNLEDFRMQHNTLEVDKPLNHSLRISDAKNIILNKETDSTLVITLLYENHSKTLTFDKHTKKVVHVTEK